jgi:hypothetical protein
VNKGLKGLAGGRHSEGIWGRGPLGMKEIRRYAYLRGTYSNRITEYAFRLLGLVLTVHFFYRPRHSAQHFGVI